VTDAKELAAAVNFQAQEQVPMPLNNAVLDFHPLGVIDTPAGPRQRVVLVAAQRDMVERLLSAVDRAGLSVEGIDLSAFALIRSLYTAGAESSEQPQRVLYLNVDGLTNLAIAEGPVCRFTRVVGGGIESMAAELAAKREITVPQARSLLLAANLDDGEIADEWVPAETAPDAPVKSVDHDGAGEPPSETGAANEEAITASEEALQSEAPSEEPPAGEEPAPFDVASASETAFDHGFEDAEFLTAGDEEVFGVLEAGIRDIYGEVRNSLDFHRSQDGGGEVSHVVLSGSAQDIRGFADALQSALGVEVKSRQAPLASGPIDGVSSHRLAVASGLAVEEIPR
jgi:type IV pilus assembly protein PilM